MERFVIINADDFGMCHSANVAVEALMECGGITSSTIMAPCAWAKEAVEIAKKHPDFAVGVHLTTTCEWANYRWAPVAGALASLVDAEGFMWPESADFANHATLQETEQELRAQIEKLLRLGLQPSHFDNHMGSLYGVDTGRFELLELTMKLCAEYAMPFRMPTKFTDEQFSNKTLDIKVPRETVDALLGTFAQGAAALRVATPDYLMPGDWEGPQKDSYEAFRAYIFDKFSHFPAGVTETYIHPAQESAELKAITASWQHRVWEYALFSDPATRAYFASLGIKLINYRDLKAMRGY